MSTDIFLGGLASLTLAAVIIVALTTNKREQYPDANKGRKGEHEEKRNTKSDW